MTWTLLIVALTGSMISTNSTFATIPMKDKSACVAAAKRFTKSSKGPIGFICVSSETGEVVGPDDLH